MHGLEASQDLCSCPIGFGEKGTRLVWGQWPYTHAALGLTASTACPVACHLF